MVFNATFNNICYIVAVSFIDGENRIKPPTCRKSLTNFIIYCYIKYTSSDSEKNMYDVTRDVRTFNHN